MLKSFKVLLVRDYGLWWPAQIVGFIATFYIVSGLCEILIGNLLLGMIVGEDAAGASQILQDMSDALSSAVICAALIMLFRLMNRDKALSGIGLTGLRSGAIKGVAGMAIGAVSMSVAMVAMVDLGKLSFMNGAPDAGAASAFVMYVGVGFTEEIFIRGTLQQTLLRRTCPAVAILAPAIVFGMIHIGNAGIGVLSMLNIIMAGIFLAVLTHVTGNLYAAIGFHTTWNYFQGIVFGMPVSGNAVAQSTFLVGNSVPGAELVNGGNFGPEGSVVATALFALLTAVILIGGRKKLRISAI